MGDGAVLLVGRAELGQLVGGGAVDVGLVGAVLGVVVGVLLAVAFHLISADSDGS